MRLFISAVMLLACVTAAEAAQKKRWYLRINNGSGGEAYVFKTKAACEAEGRRRMQIQQYLDRRPKQFESKIRYSNPRCLDRLPHGYMPPP
jgi:hypothetical protein